MVITANRAANREATRAATRAANRDIFCICIILRNIT